MLHDAAKELTQQCFIRLWQYRETLSEAHPLEKQVFIIDSSSVSQTTSNAPSEVRLRYSARTLSDHFPVEAQVEHHR